MFPEVKRSKAGDPPVYFNRLDELTESYRVPVLNLGELVCRDVSD
jgi:hypothetical protein